MYIAVRIELARGSDEHTKKLWRKARTTFAALALLMLFTASSTMAQKANTPPAKYDPNWKSLDQHPFPQWFDDAKFGIFIHWGLFSVPAWAPAHHENKSGIDWAKVEADPTSWFKYNPYAEWYLNTLSIPGSPTREYHDAKYGADYPYLNFVPIFNHDVQNWNPEEWAHLFRQVGARYVVLVTKHHDGFTLWPSAVRNPHRKREQQGASRDLVGDLTTAVRAQGLRMGLYYSGGLDWSFVPPPIVSLDDLIAHIPQSEEYAHYADGQVRELITRYHPSVLWDDISYPKAGDLDHIFAEYYDQVPDGLINDRFRVEHSDFTTPEYRQYKDIVQKKWETCRGLGFSFGFNQNEGPQQVLSAAELVRLLVEIVSKNGNLLLNIGPKADGTIPDIQVERLRALGAWLGVNGEGIYGTRPWVRPNGKTSADLDIRYTQKNGSAYAFLMDKPKSREITIQSLVPERQTTITMLGSNGTLTWTAQGTSIHVTLPEHLPGDYVYALKITPKPWQLVK